jgi:hypothetical protein
MAARFPPECAGESKNTRFIAFILPKFDGRAKWVRPRALPMTLYVYIVK